MAATNDLINLIGETTGGGVAILTGIRYLWRRWSKDMVEVAKDRVEVDILTNVNVENKRLRDELNIVNAERNKLASEAGRLEVMVEVYKDNIKRLEAELFKKL
jgi:hypothetical protein